MRAGTGSSARIGTRTHKSCPFVLLRVRIDVHRVYEYPRMHLLYCGLELEEARRIIRVAFGGGVSSSAAMRGGDSTVIGREQSGRTKPVPNHKGSGLQKGQDILRWACESTNSRGEDEYAAVLHLLTDWSAARCSRVTRYDLITCGDL